MALTREYAFYGEQQLSLSGIFVLSNIKRDTQHFRTRSFSIQHTTLTCPAPLTRRRKARASEKPDATSTESSRLCYTSEFT